jgi:ADP-ribosyl-[dinitrogen reductase] hydrolase
MQNIIRGEDKKSAYENAKKLLLDFFDINSRCKNEKSHFAKVLYSDISIQAEKNIYGSGYVVESLEAALWCFLKNDNYTDTVLQAVNLGEDTDTTATITGALAGLYYGLEQIPEAWRNQLARQADIADLIQRFYEKV